ncbi:hypothetical protein [Streptomyces sp. B6B3]|uniref:hypothetical protein n=1 Tax=Streptomyces sp. B6B3 TaxID=3153570 RepID=UPI00325DD36C
MPAITASAVLLLGACSSDDSDSEGDGGSGLGQSESTGGSGSEEGSGSEGGTEEDSGSEGGTGGGGEVPSDADVEGGWSNVEHGLGLYVTQGMFSVGNADGSMSCTGTYSGGSLEGQCQDGSSFSGTATLNDDTLNVQLDTGDGYDFTRAGDMDIPEMPEVPDM